MPRNDIFFDKNTIKKIAKKIKKYYKIFGENKVILYAPTFRDNNFNNTINLNSLISIFNKDDDNVVIMLRTHPHKKKIFLIILIILLILLMLQIIQICRSFCVQQIF